MKIVHIGTNTTGGAGLGMMQLHKALLARGVESRILTMKIRPEDAEDPTVAVVGPDSAEFVDAPDEFADKVGAMVETIRKRDRLPVSSPYSRLRLERHPFVREADVVHLHWVSNMVDVQTFFRNIDKPVVWTIRDENPMMGLYHIRRDVPAAPVRDEKVMDEYLRTMKEQAIGQCRDLTFVALCDGIGRVVRTSGIGQGRPVAVIPNAVNGKVFRPAKREETRAAYAISPEETVLIFVAQALSMKHKGLQDLLQALSLIDRSSRRITLMCVGNGRVPDGVPAGVRVVIPGFVTDSTRLAALYSAADVMVSPSYSETFGKTMSEALACGTPVVSYPNHGALDMIADGENGFIAEAFNPYAFARALEKALATKFASNVLHERTCRRYAPETVADMHLALYKGMLDTPLADGAEKAASVACAAPAPSSPKRIRLSIITICYNNAGGLSQTLRSTLRDQPSFADFEQIVVDGGSTDGTADVISEYKDRLSWWCSEKDEGIYNAMNKGVMHARGEYLLFLNSGDILKTDMLAEVFREPFDEDIVYSDIYTFKPSGVALCHAADIEELTPGWFLYNTLPHQAMLIKKSLHDRLGGYDETMKISAAPKFAFQAVVEEKCSIRKLACPFSVYDCSGVSSQHRYMLQKFKEREKFLTPYYGRRVSACAWQWSISRLLADPDMLMMLGKNTDIAPALKAHVRECIKNPALFQKPAVPPPKLVSPKPVPQARPTVPGATATEIRNLKARLKNAEFEVANLRRSAAYRTGMFVTWPLRKIYRAIRPIRDRRG